jgi:hypothetical protein
VVHDFCAEEPRRLSEPESCFNLSSARLEHFRAKTKKSEKGTLSLFQTLTTTFYEPGRQQKVGKREQAKER